MNAQMTLAMRPFMTAALALGLCFPACDGEPEHVEQPGESESKSGPLVALPGTSPVTTPGVAPVAPSTAAKLAPSYWERPTVDGRRMTDDESRERARLNLKRARDKRRASFRAGKQRVPAQAELIATTIRQRGKDIERKQAIVAMGDRPWPEMVLLLNTLMHDTTDKPEVRAEAAIRLYRWGQQDKALPYLMEFQRNGVKVTPAVQGPWHKQGYSWQPGAETLLRAGLSSLSPDVRADCAVGLMEMGVIQEGLAAIRKVVLREPSPPERIRAVARLRSMRHLPAVRALYGQVTHDKEPRIAALAKKILAGGGTP
ncbi:MAG: hypothetical protein ACI9MR_000778 [Myxococcota bacterium]|jgi:hypothetical protein